ncbi:DegT/DnrJ/EryC1/StrS family aminotransferase [Mesorhizobium marinum]|uniref:DegT/DnrJ/EryC1/StrS family aminotransferase n=1 Tax=Mesorhizobium marinum TaxID=3228790 RepID=A0ABV3R0P5_9HYPH
MEKPAYPFIIPDIPRTSEWIPVYERVFETGIYANFGPISRSLETSLAARYAVSGYEAVTCCSATQGLLAALLARFDAGMNIALPNFTFAATYHAIRLAGLNPVPVDIDADTLEISIESLAEAMGKMTLHGVVSVRPFGLVRDQSHLIAFCRDRRLPLTFDAAASLGGASLPKFGSDDGEVEVFSLHATKVFAIGEGGVILAPADAAVEIRKKLNFGFEADRRYSTGTNGKMDELHAAIALSQLGRVDEMQQAREEIAHRYDSFFASVPGARTLQGVTRGSGWTMYPVVFEGQSADEIVRKAQGRGIETRRYYWPSVSNAVGASLPTPVSLEVSNRVSNQIVCFPVYSANAGNLRDGLFEALGGLFA